MTEFGRKQLLAEGRLSWPKAERHTERYGVVSIQTAGCDPAEYEREQVAKLLARAEVSQGQGSVTRMEVDPTADHAVFQEAPIGMIGRLLVEVTQTRDLHHRGDSARDLQPTTPEVGEELVLGEGTLFTEEEEGITSIGVSPEDGRATDWLDVNVLYRVHDQTLKLYFEPREA